MSKGKPCVVIYPDHNVTYESRTEAACDLGMAVGTVLKCIESESSELYGHPGVYIEDAVCELTKEQIYSAGYRRRKKARSQCCCGYVDSKTGEVYDVPLAEVVRVTGLTASSVYTYAYKYARKGTGGKWYWSQSSVRAFERELKRKARR